VFPVKTIDFQANISDERNNKWGRLVSPSLALVIDLHGTAAVHNQQCSVIFRSFRNISKQDLSQSDT